MIFQVDMSSLPPRVELIERDDFTAFKVLVVGDHAFVSRDAIIAFAGEDGLDPAWLDQLDAMLQYAARSGWTGADGTVAAHVDHAGA
jgi:hypothetical protein